MTRDPKSGDAAAVDRRPSIELSTVAFFRGMQPRMLSLRQCAVPTTPRLSSGFFAFYGHQGKQDGLGAARAYATSRGASYTVVDLLVELQAQNPQIMKSAELANFDFLNLARASKGLAQHISEALLADAIGAIGEDVTALLAEGSLRAAVAGWPTLMESIADLDVCRHLKVIAFAGASDLTQRPVGMAYVPFRHWDCVKDAHCRLNPTILIEL